MAFFIVSRSLLPHARASFSSLSRVGLSRPLASLSQSSLLSSSSFVPLSPTTSKDLFLPSRLYSQGKHDHDQYQQQHQHDQYQQQHPHDQYQQQHEQYQQQHEQYQQQYQQQHPHDQYQQHHPHDQYQQQHPHDQYQQHHYHEQHQHQLQQQQEQEQHEEEAKKKGLGGRIASVGAGGALIFGGKAKSALAALKLTKFSSLISMGASTLAYSFLFGLPYAAGMVGLILIHESGHALAMHRFGIPFSPMVFIPFMGAVVGMKETPKCPRQMALIALAGPALGGAAAVGTYLLGVNLDSQLLLALGNFGMMVNLFNLLPIGSMDGGRVAEILSKWFLVGGWATGAALLYTGTLSSPLFYLIMLSATWTTGKRVLGYHTPLFLEQEVPGGVKAEVLAAYLAITGGLLYGMTDSVKRMKSPAQIRHEMAEENGEDEELGEFAESLFKWSDDEELK